MNNTYYTDDWIEQRAARLEEQQIPLFEAGLMIGWLGGFLTTVTAVTLIQLLL